MKGSGSLQNSNREHVHNSIRTFPNFGGVQERSPIKESSKIQIKYNEDMSVTSQIGEIEANWQLEI